MTKREAKKIAARELHSLINNTLAPEDYGYTEDVNELIQEEFEKIAHRLLNLLDNILYPKPRSDNKQKQVKPRKSDDIFNRMNHNIQILREVVQAERPQDSN